MSDWNPDTDIPNLAGKVAVVTGASVGIGFDIVRRLAQSGAKVFATTRTAENAKKAQEKLKAHPGIDSKAVEWMPMELTDLKSITEVASDLRKRTSQLHILINNAAAVAPSSKTLVGDRWEMNMAVNVVGTLLFVNRLIPLLESTSKIPGADVRVVTISSVAATTFLPANFQFQFNSASGLRSPVASYPAKWRYLLGFLFNPDLILYSVSKAGVMIVASKLQDVFDERGLDILSLVVHPGETATEGMYEANGPFIRTLARLTFSSPEQTSATPLFAATAKRVPDDRTQFRDKLIIPIGKTADLHSVVKDEEQVQGLWNLVNRELAHHLEAEWLAPLEKW